MTPPGRIYLDNAATTFPKPEPVYAAVDSYNRTNGAAVGRGAYRSSVAVTGVVDRCRKRLADLLGAAGPDRFVFTFNCTDSLNLALYGLAEPGDHIITSAMDHNSVLRPLSELRRKLGIETTIVEADATGLVDPAAIRRSLRPNTKLICLVHASNVSGTIQPIADAGEIAHDSGALLLVDAAQTAGHIPINLRDLPVDLLAGPGHKGLLGPLGTGFLYLRPGIEERLVSFRQGGTGTRSETDVQPQSLPDKYESGNHNAPGLVGLEASLSWLLERGVASIHEQTAALTSRLGAGFAEIPGVRLFGPPANVPRVGVVSMAIAGMEPHDVGAILDQTFGIEVRAGLHCAPRAHRSIGSFELPGTVRFSVGPFTTVAEIDAAIDAVRQIAATA